MANLLQTTKIVMQSNQPQHKLSQKKGASCGQHSALSTQHSALSTQHSALSTQHLLINKFIRNAWVLALFFFCTAAHAFPYCYINQNTESEATTRKLACEAEIAYNNRLYAVTNPTRVYTTLSFWPPSGQPYSPSSPDRMCYSDVYENDYAGNRGMSVLFLGHADCFCKKFDPITQNWTDNPTIDPAAIDSGRDLTQLCQPNLILTLSPAPNQKDPYPAGTGGKSTYELIAKVTENGNPKAGVTVTFAVEPIANSGGHDHHDASRPKGSVPSSGETDSKGEIPVKFQASQIAGTHVIAAFCSRCTNNSVTKNVDVKVPDLVPFLALPFRTQQWNPVGIGWTKEHTDNHYLTIAATYRLLEIADKYRKIWPTAPKLTLNDASLVWGGKFDIPGTWERDPQRHAEHRLGDNIDIRANTLPGAVPSGIRPEVLRWLRKLSTKKDNIPVEYVIESVNPLHEGVGLPNEHFHLRLGN